WNPMSRNDRSRQISFRTLKKGGSMSRRAARTLIVAVALSFCCHSAPAQVGGGGLTLPAEDEPENMNATLTWIQWWETNRDIFIRRALADHSDVKKSPEKTAARDKAAAALLEASSSASADLRAEAALALARTRDGKDRILELTKDSAQRTRCR